MIPIKRILAALGAFALAALPLPNVWALDAAEEYEIKTVYLFNLGGFMHWPENMLANAKHFEICVLGQNPFGDNLSFVVGKQKTIQSKPVTIRHFEAAEQADGCHILFISDSEQLRLEAIFNALRGKPILLVGNSERFVVQGGMIQFYPRDGKIRLMLDPQTIEEAGLKASAHLMRIARLIER